MGQICPKVDLGLEIQKTNVEIRISILKILGSNFQNLSADSKSAPPRDHVRQFLVKMNKFEFFGINLGKLPNYVRYFGSNNVEGVAES